MFKRTRAYWEAKMLELEKLKMGLEKKYIGKIKNSLEIIKKKFIRLLLDVRKRIEKQPNFLFQIQQDLFGKAYKGMSNLKAISMFIQETIYDFLKEEFKLAVEFLSTVFKDIYRSFADILNKGFDINIKYKKYKENDIKKKIFKLWERQTKTPKGRIYKYGKISFSSIFDGFGSDLIGDMTNIIIKDTKKKIREEVSVNNIIKKIIEVENKTESELRTQATFQMNQAMYELYVENDVEKYMYSAILDARTSVMCRELDGQIFRMDEAIVGINYPPLHLNCRSFTIPYN